MNPNPPNHRSLRTTVVAPRSAALATTQELTPANALTVLSLLSCVRRRWKQTVALGSVVAAAAALCVWLFLPPAKPHAYTKLYFPTKPAGSIDHPDPPINQLTQKELVTSRIVLKAVVEDPAIASLSCITEKGDPISWLLRDLAVDFPAGSEIMRLTLTDVRAEEAKTIIDKVAQVYMAKIGNESVEYRRKHMAKLQEMVEQARKELNDDIDASSTGTGGTGAVSPEVNAQRLQMINTEINQLNAEVNKSRPQLAALRADEDSLARRLSKTPLELTPAEFEPLFAQNPGANRLKQLRDELAAEYDLKSAGLGAGNPTMVNLKARIDAAEVRLQALRSELRNTIAVAAQEKLGEELRKKRDEIARLQTEEKTKTAEVTTKQGEFEKLKEAMNNGGRFKPGLRVKGSRLEDLQNRLMKLEGEMGAPIVVRQLEEEAVIVRINDASRRMKLAGIAGVAFFGMTFLGLAFVEFRANRIASPDEVAQSLGLRLMGTVPALPRGGRADGEWEAVVNEAVDSARTIFLHSVSLHHLRSVMVASAVGGEGKTSLSVRLAGSLARTGRKTLLIDADLRNPSVHDHFGLSGEVGVCDVLRGERAVVETILPTSRENLWVLPAGRCDSRAVQALARDGFSGLLAATYAQGFDFVLVDSSPVLPVADALLVAPHVDGVLFSLMVDVSQADRVNAACQKLAAIDIPLLGAVVNGTRGETYGYGPRYLAPVRS